MKANDKIIEDRFKFLVKIATWPYQGFTINEDKSGVCRKDPASRWLLSIRQTSDTPANETPAFYAASLEAVIDKAIMYFNIKAKHASELKKAGL